MLNAGQHVPALSFMTDSAGKELCLRNATVSHCYLMQIKPTTVR
ncbi:hypothetical protein CKO_05025 [Citrobacter koseri ATCC BAA-895]|uniref:Uncharacterized protein n=1 Tax=Citrobacter koseri (strain ATCC BAA-895 / CDC 4225-83 / SGSC4696) TaxID=290338 RepID=A8ARF5_CITK8|nr:hypothetical protein CKO_05025 [Citrobacter koseri ATCC BAA-895]